MGMSREETVKNLLTELIDMIDTGSQRDLDRADEIVASIIKLFEQESIDYKTQYENYLKKSEVVISQLRADRDRLQDAFDKIDEIITDALDKSTDQKESQTLRWVLDKISEVT